MRVEIEERGQELNNFDEIIKKVVDGKTKASLNLRSYTGETN